MVEITKQMKEWMGKFGRNYTDRSALSLTETDRLYKKTYGIRYREITNLFLGKLSRKIRILEVGSNVGNKLSLLQEMGFKNLYGIEINKYAIELAKLKTRNINIIYGSAFDIPFKDGYFDLVFTSGLLIHIAPTEINIALREIHRCAKKYIWGFEYYSDKYAEVIYRGKKKLLWKANFLKSYLNLFKDLELVRGKTDKIP